MSPSANFAQKFPTKTLLCWTVLTTVYGRGHNGNINIVRRAPTTEDQVQKGNILLPQNKIATNPKDCQGLIDKDVERCGYPVCLYVCLLSQNLSLEIQHVTTYRAPVRGKTQMYQKGNF